MDEYKKHIEFAKTESVKYWCPDDVDFNKLRKNENVYSRYFAWNILREYTPLSDSQLGSIYCKHRTTVIAGLRTFSSLYGSDKFFRGKYDKFDKDFRDTFINNLACKRYKKELSQTFNYEVSKFVENSTLGNVLLGI
jgi:hypothetical protein